MALRFTSIYRKRGHEKILYELLRGRPRHMNISHRRFPVYAEHCKFVRSKPYKQWNFIMKDDVIIGSVYLSKLNEIGIFLFKSFRGAGLEKKAVVGFLALLSDRRLIANVSPKNPAYAKLFKSLGFRHVQDSYVLERDR